MSIRRSIPEREFRIPIEPSDIEEASLLLLELGSRRAAVARYEELKSMDTDVSLAAASILKAKILRADEIKAWSTSVKKYFSTNESENIDTVSEVINDNGDGGYHNGVNDMPLAMLPSLFLPYLSTIIEANLRLKDIDRQGGIIGVDCSSVNNYEEVANSLSEIDDEDLNDIYLWDAVASNGLTGYMFFSTSNARTVYQSLNVPEGRKCVLYRADAENVAWEHGAITATSSYAIYRLYLALLFNKTIEGNCYYISDKDDRLAIQVFSPNLKGYNSMLGLGHDSKMNIVQYEKGPVFKHGKKQQLGDFPGVHAGAFGDTLGSKVAGFAGDIIGGTLLYRYGRPFLGKIVAGSTGSAAVTQAKTLLNSGAAMKTAGQGGLLTWIKGLGSKSMSWFQSGSKAATSLSLADKAGKWASTASTTNTSLITMATANAERAAKAAQTTKYGSKILGVGRFLASKHIIAALIWLIVGGAIAGFLSRKAYQLFDSVTFGGFGWAEYFTRFEAVIAKSKGVLQPGSDEFVALSNKGYLSTDKLDQCVGIHGGYVQSDDIVPKIIDQLNEGVPMVEDCIANGWLSSINNCGYRL